MGNDGGSIPRRDELVKQKGKDKVVESKDEALQARWLVCTLSKEPLRPPVVACGLGNLYNKEEVLKFLIDRQSFGDPPNLAHIRRIKDVQDVTLTPIQASARSKGEASAAFCCPITTYPMNGRYRYGTAGRPAGRQAGWPRAVAYPCAAPAAALRLPACAGLCSCGRAAACSPKRRCARSAAPTARRYAARALSGRLSTARERLTRRVGSFGACAAPQCTKAYTPDDAVPIYGDAAEVERLRTRLEVARANAKEAKKKDKAGAEAGAGSASGAGTKRNHVEIAAGIDAKAIVAQAEKRAREQTPAIKSLFHEASKDNDKAKPANWVSMGTHLGYIS